MLYKSSQEITIHKRQQMIRKFENNDIDAVMQIQKKDLTKISR